MCRNRCPHHQLLSAKHLKLSSTNTKRFTPKGQHVGQCSTKMFVHQKVFKFKPGKTAKNLCATAPLWQQLYQSPVSHKIPAHRTFAKIYTLMSDRMTGVLLFIFGRKWKLFVFLQICSGNDGNQLPLLIHNWKFAWIQDQRHHNQGTRKHRIDQAVHTMQVTCSSWWLISLADTYLFYFFARYRWPRARWHHVVQQSNLQVSSSPGNVKKLFILWSVLITSPKDEFGAFLITKEIWKYFWLRNTMCSWVQSGTRNLGILHEDTSQNPV